MLTTVFPRGTVRKSGSTLADALSPPCRVFVSHLPTCRSRFQPLVVVAYVDVATVQFGGRDHLERPLNGRRKWAANLPVVSRYRTLLKRHTPSDPLRDPYLVAVLIALAQRQRRRTRMSRQQPPRATSPYVSFLGHRACM